MNYSIVPILGTKATCHYYIIVEKSIYSSKYQILLSWLKEQRIAKGFSMRKLAEKLQCHHSFISKTEQGKRRLDLIEYMEYCKALNIDPVEGLNLIRIKNK